MCFSYAVNFSPNALKSKFGIEQVPLPQQGFFFNGFEHPSLPVMYVPQNQTQFEVSNFEWGLIPSWIKDEKKAMELRKNSLNARSETAFEKPMFHHAWEKNPCIVLASGFFEWEHVGQQKIPHYIYSSQREVLFMAGIYEKWYNSFTGSDIYSFSIVTTHANTLMEKIHNTKKRMPVILDEKGVEIWLKESAIERQQLSKPCANEDLKEHIVSQKINSSKINRNEAWALEPAFFANQTRLF